MHHQLRTGTAQLLRGSSHRQQRVLHLSNVGRVADTAVAPPVADAERRPRKVETATKRFATRHDDQLKTILTSLLTEIHTITHILDQYELPQNLRFLPP